MRTVFFLFVVLAATGSSLRAGNELGLDEGKARVFRSGDVIRLIYEDQSPCKLAVTIRDDDGSTIHREKIVGHKGFIRPYDFSALEHGVYWLTLSDGESKVVKKIDYRELKEDELNVYSAELDGEMNQIRCLVSVAVDDEEEITITVEDDQHHILHNESEVVNHSFARVYRIVNPGDGVSIRVANGKGQTKTFYHHND